MTSGSCRRIDRNALEKLSPGFVIHRNLADTVHFVFNRVFDRHDIHRLLPDFIDERVERRRLSASGWTYCQEHSLRSANQTVQALLDSRLESKLAESHEGAASPQHSNDDFSAPPCREHRNPNVGTPGLLESAAVIYPSCGIRRSLISSFARTLMPRATH
jgi:hypothetical protein